jgi:hypothetical protein
MVKTDTILTIAAVVAGGYVIYKLTEPLTKTTEQVGSSIGSVANTGASTFGRVGEAVGSYADIFDTFFDKVKSGIQGNAQPTTETVTIFEKGKATNTYTQPITKPSSAVQNAAIAQASAFYSGASYDQKTGTLLKDNKGYSVAEVNVPKLLKGIQTGIQPTLKSDGTVSKLKPALFAVKK